MHWKGTQYIFVKEMCNPRGIVLPNPPSIPVPFPHPIGLDPKTAFLPILLCQWFPFLWSVWSSVLTPQDHFSVWLFLDPEKILVPISTLAGYPPFFRPSTLLSAKDPVWSLVLCTILWKMTQQRNFCPNLKSWYLGMQPYLEIESLWM